MKRIRFLTVLVLLLSAFAFGAFETQEALAVAPCGTVCQSLDDCYKKCACETSEWGVKVEFCYRCPYVPNNPCT